MPKTVKQTEFKEVDARVNVDELERGILEFWDKEDIFHQALEQTKDRELFTFYDGPPYATGKPHYGHILQSAIKDTVLRYKTMQGYHVPRRVGWDCHGLPVENLVEKELGFKTKKEIEDDIEGFNKKCREMVYRYIGDFTSILKRIGRWADYDQAYSTLDRDYMESEWWVFKQLWDQGLVYKDFRSTPYCIRCATPLSNFEVSMAYKDVTDTAVYVLFPVEPDRLLNRMDDANRKLALLVWTTTPWTLPGNLAIAFNPKLEYVTVPYKEWEVILAKDRVQAIFGSDAKVENFDMAELRGQPYVYKPPYDVFSVEELKNKDVFLVGESEHVNAQDGTGLVHIAPAFGEDDFQLGKNWGLPLRPIVGLTGKYLDDVPQWGGEHIFKANKKITADLQGRGLLWKEEQYTHSYPHCWRCDTPLIYYALDSWFVWVTKLKNQMLKNNEQIHWVPEHVKKGRFGKGIESAPDWAVSRNRFWSVPMPVWVCDQCDQQVVVGSVKELQELSAAGDEQVQDIHRPYVDTIAWKCTKCAGTMRRVAEVLDVWFDSGSMPYAQWHYPFEGEEFVQQGFPANFIAESIEMTRAWFYVLHVLATALTQKNIGLGEHTPAYKNVIASGLVFGEDGKKLSKKLKNYPEIEPALHQYGADMLRFYLLSSTSLGEPYYFSEKDLRQLQRNVYMTLWNVYSFFTRYAKVNSWKRKVPSKKRKLSEHILDTWVLARVAQLEREVMLAADGYHIDMAARLFIPFIDDVSNWYVRRSRQRFQRPASPAEAEEAFGTLHEVLVRTARLVAPFMPFVSEEVYKNLTGEASVHLSRLSAPTDFDESLLAQMQVARDFVSAGLAVRAAAGIKVRQPLSRMVVVSKAQLAQDLLAIIQEEVNAKEIEMADVLPVGKEWAVSNEEGLVKVALDATITDELAAEGVARDIIRHGQVLRREAGYALDDRIVLIVASQDPNVWAVIRVGEKMIMEALQVDTFAYEGEEDAGAEIKILGQKVHIGVKRV